MSDVETQEVNEVPEEIDVVNDHPNEETDQAETSAEVSQEDSQEETQEPAKQTDEEIHSRVAEEQGKLKQAFSERVSDESEPEQTEHAETQKDETEFGMSSGQLSDIMTIANQLAEMSPAIQAARSEWEHHKTEAAAAKKELDKLHKDSDALMLEMKWIQGGNYQRRLPLENEEPHPDVEAGKHRPHGTPVLEAAAQAQKSEPKIDPGIKAPIHQLGNPDVVGDLALTDSLVDKLMDNGIDFIYKLEDLLKKAAVGGFAWHKDVKGIAKGTATKVEDAREAWRRINPIPVPDDEPDESETVVSGSQDEPQQPEDTPDDIPDTESDEASQDAPDELEWYCQDCGEHWPAVETCRDPKKPDLCPDCGNRTGNELLGYFGCRNVNSDGEIITGLELIDLLEDTEPDDTLNCQIYLFEHEGRFYSGGYCEDSDKEETVSISPKLSEFSSPTREAELFYITSQLQDEVMSDRLFEIFKGFKDQLYPENSGERVQCTDCETVAIHQTEGEAPCRFCGKTGFVLSD